MPSWFKSGSAKGKNAKTKTKIYDNMDGQDLFDDDGLDNDGSLTTELYMDGVAPVTISIKNNEEIMADAGQCESPPMGSLKFRSQKQPIGMFVDQEGEEVSMEEKNPPKMIGSGDLAGNVGDLDFCCIEDGAIECLGFDRVVICSADDEDDGQKSLSQSQSQTRSIASNSDSAEKIRSIGPVNDNGSDELDAIRGMGSFMDRSISNGVAYYLKQCVPEPSSKTGASKNRLFLVLLLISTLLLAVIGGIVGFTLQRQRTKKVSEGTKGYDFIESFEDNSVETQFRSLLDLTASSDWETEGSPQNQALRWLVYEDPAGLTVESSSEEVIKERFAAATLYFATNGPESWKTSLGFLGGNSICDWNNDGVEESLGIFCGEDGSVDEINIVGHNMSGSLPNELNYFSEISVLNLFYNGLTGPIPDLSYLVKLEQIDLDSNKLSGFIPESIFNLPSITNLFLLNNKDLNGRIPEIESSSKLVNISLLGCSIFGTIPASMGGVGSLRLLQLKDNYMTGSIPPNLLSLPNLETLGLDGNRLTGTIPRVRITFQGSALKSLSLGSNSLEGSLPDGLEDLTALQFLYADDNMLTGSIRSVVMGLPNLEQLWLQGNNMSGDLGFSLFESSVVSDVYLANNDFSGDLQDFLQFAPPSIQRLDLSGNRAIEGYIPAEIGNFGAMRYFNVSSCSLGGEIPKAIGRLRNLETLDLSTNDFQGDVPDEIADMVSLTSFDISRNRDLGGDLSSSLCDSIGKDLVFALADCNGDVRIECDCCTHCCTREGVCGPN